MRLTVFAADALTASDKQDTDGENHCEDSFFLHVEYLLLEFKGNALGVPLG